MTPNYKPYPWRRLSSQDNEQVSQHTTKSLSISIPLHQLRNISSWPPGFQHSSQTGLHYFQIQQPSYPQMLPNNCFCFKLRSFNLFPKTPRTQSLQYPISTNVLPSRISPWHTNIAFRILSQEYNAGYFTQPLLLYILGKAVPLILVSLEHITPPDTSQMLTLRSTFTDT